MAFWIKNFLQKLNYEARSESTPNTGQCTFTGFSYKL